MCKANISKQRNSPKASWASMVRENREKEFESLPDIEKLRILFECNKEAYLNGFDYSDQVGADDFDKAAMQMCINGKMENKSKE